ncbi:hypothetical protein [Pseudomonas guariconensis]|uniref:hypothetical protein n=1 Tax=Pseudomonas guariconensis TaxID=1288410 RepID=UPI0034661774
MPWYRTGQVAITAGQTTVTGTGTSFSANGRVGDGFLGPDGRWYEITNIASNTVLSILPAYQGATVSGGSYAVAPLQGYPKTLADKFNDIANQWGSTLAGLGTVSTENVVPVAKGGTGGTTQADARLGLGLGTASTTDSTTSTEDATLGRSLRVGDHGVGRTNNATGNLPAGALIGAIAANSFFAAADSAPSDWPGGAGNLPMGFNISRSANVGAQFAMSSGAAAGAYRRARISSASWGAWAKLLEATDFVTVTNANGTAIRLPDGTQICLLNISVTDQAIDSSYSSGSVQLYQGVRSWTFPAVFTAPPTVIPGAFRHGSGASWSALGGTVTTNAAPLRGIDIISRAAGPTVVISAAAIGRYM